MKLDSRDIFLLLILFEMMKNLTPFYFNFQCLLFPKCDANIFFLFKHKKTLIRKELIFSQN